MPAMKIMNATFSCSPEVSLEKYGNGILDYVSIEKATKLRLELRNQYA